MATSSVLNVKLVLQMLHRQSRTKLQTAKQLATFNNMLFELYQGQFAAEPSYWSDVRDWIVQYFDGKKQFFNFQAQLCLDYSDADLVSHDEPDLVREAVRFVRLTQTMET